MVAAQIENVGARPRTLSPNEGPVEALGVTVHRNGYQADVLESVGVQNLGTAGPSDLAEMRLWQDGGNGTFDAGAGDDVDRGPLTNGAGTTATASSGNRSCRPSA